MRKIISIALLTMLFLTIGFLGWRSYKTLMDKKKAKETIQNMPDLKFKYIKRGNDVKDKVVVVNYFSPDCSHCQYMARQIDSNKAAFSSIAFIMITPASDSAAVKFSKEYELDKLPFLSMATDKAGTFYRIFGTGGVPAFFIYNKKHQLVASIMGETKIENIVDAINK